MTYDRYMKKSHIHDMIKISMCVAITVICAWISIPFVVNFTLQTFSIFVICSVFGLKISLPSVLLYIALGAVGVPVFSGFGAGIGVIFGPTGGYLLGFLLIPPIMHIFLRNNKGGILIKCVAMFTSLCACYAVGTLWYYIAFGAKNDSTLWGILTVCVLPFLIPDLIKIVLAAIISRRLESINSNSFGGLL